MKAARLHEYHEALKLDEVDEPKAAGPLDVVVRIGAAGLCRTDLHIQEGQWAEKSGVKLPYTPGHENAGWVHEVGSGVTNVEVGDTVIVHPFITCGLCRPCRARRRHALRERLVPRASTATAASRTSCSPARARWSSSIRRSSRRTSRRWRTPGLTAIHAVKKAIPVLGSGTKVVVIGAGGLGHIGIQCLKAMTPTEIIVVDPSEPALALARELGRRPHGPGRRQRHVEKVQELTDGRGAQAIIDFVGENGADRGRRRDDRRTAASTTSSATARTSNIPTIDVISREISFIGNLVGTYVDLRGPDDAHRPGPGHAAHDAPIRWTRSTTRWPTSTTAGSRAAGS